jgi:hypothetical protein
MKFFLISIDTEGDNLWDYRRTGDITTKNAEYIPRFQKLCEQYNYKPVYLVNYEMAKNPYFVDFANKALADKACEIGIHPHAWNNPPDFALPYPALKNSGLPYLIEYPPHIMREKFYALYKVLLEKFDTEIVSHRAGRWAMNQDYFDMLIDYGIQIDCSVTPHVSWENVGGFSVDSKGTDYSAYPENPTIIKHSENANTLLEVPLTIRKIPFRFFLKHSFSPRLCLSGIKKTFKGSPLWFRPNGKNLEELLLLIEHIKDSESDYIMFMLHSSELMPGGSPSFKSAASIEHLYDDLRVIFSKLSLNFEGITLKDYLGKH